MQRHINRGSCNCIDYMADQQGVLRKEEAFLDSLLWGTWKSFIEGVNNKMLLTTTCTLCGQGLKRAADLMRHILAQHGPFHKASEHYTAMIEETHPECSCNPATGQQRRSHRCMAHQQIAMMHHILNPGHLQILVPWETTQQAVINLLSNNPHLLAQAPSLATWISSRTFDQIWLDRHTCRALSHCCSVCNRVLDNPLASLDHLTNQHGELTGKIMHLLMYVGLNVKAQGFGIPCLLCGESQK